MEVDFSDRSLDDIWRANLDAVQRRYSADPNAENRAEFRRLLRLFADLVVRGQMPRRIASSQIAELARIMATGLAVVLRMVSQSACLVHNRTGRTQALLVPGSSIISGGNSPGETRSE
jgi:hypothetical protein